MSSGRTEHPRAHTCIVDTSSKIRSLFSVGARRYTEIHGDQQVFVGLAASISKGPLLAPTAPWPCGLMHGFGTKPNWQSYTFTAVVSSLMLCGNPEALIADSSLFSFLGVQNQKLASRARSFESFCFLRTIMCIHKQRHPAERQSLVIFGSRDRGWCSGAHSKPKG